MSDIFFINPSKQLSKQTVTIVTPIAIEFKSH